MNKEKLRERCYEMGNSQLPLDVFYNDIRDNKAPNFNKEEAYADLEKIVDYIEKLQKENQELLVNKNVAQGIAKKFKEKTDKLKKAIEILKDNHEITLHYDDEFPTPMISINGVYSYINEEEYELLNEGLGNEN